MSNCIHDWIPTPDGKTFTCWKCGDDRPRQPGEKTFMTTFRAHNYETARADAEKRSKEAGKKLLPVLGYTNGVPHYLMEDGQHRRADCKRRDVSGKALRKERLAQRAKFRQYRDNLIAQFGAEKAQEIINAAMKAAQPARTV